MIPFRLEGKNQSSIEVDFMVGTKDVGLEITLECKAITKANKNHYKSILHYLEATGQEFGILVSAAP